MPSPPTTIATLGVLAAVAAVARVAGGPPWLLAGPVTLACVVAWSAVAIAWRSPACDLTAEGTHENPVERILVLVGSAAGALALYRPALRIGLLSDDYPLLMWARRWMLLPPDWEQMRPLPLAAWAVIAQATGTAAAPTALHALNIAVHALNAFFVWLIARRMTRDPTAALVAGAIFLALPASVEPVAWASGVSDVLLTAFALAAALIVTVRPTLRIPDYVAVVVLTLAMIASKETGVVAGILTMLVYWARWGRITRGAVALAVGQLMLAGSYALARELAGRLSHRLAPHVDILRLAQLVWQSFGTLSLPLHRDVVSAHPVAAAAWLTVLIAALATWALRWRRSPAEARTAVLALAGTLVCVAPAISLFGITPDLQGSRYVYLASAWWSIALASALNPRPQPPSLRLAAAGCLALVVAGATIATRMHLGPWERARAERDRVLGVLVSLPATCSQAAATRVTDNVAGAYVFRNGLNQALDTLGRSFEWVEPERATAECRVDISPP